MFFHCIIFTKQGQSHRPTGRGAGSRAAPRKPLIPLTDSVLRTLGRGPWAMGRDRRRAGGSARTWAGIERQGIERQGIERQGIERQGIGPGDRAPGDRAPGDRAPASSTGIEHRHRAPASSARGSSTGIERQGIDGGGPGRTVRGPADQPGRALISGRGPWARGSRRRFQGSRARALGP